MPPPGGSHKNSNTESRGYSGGFGGSGSGYGGSASGYGGVGAGASGGFGGGNSGGGWGGGGVNYGGGGNSNYGGNYGGIGAGFGSSVGAGGNPSGYGGGNLGGMMGGPPGSLGGIGSFGSPGNLGGLIGGMGGLPGSIGGIGAFGSPSVPGGLWGGSSDYGKPRQNPFSDPSRFTFGGKPLSKVTREALAGVDNSLLSRLAGLQAAYGKPMNINSAYRDPATNKRVGGATKSMHLSGQAVDIGIPEKTIAATQDFIGLASKFGFGGIGVYGPGTVHVDTGPKRSWGPNYHASSIPGWAGGAVASHLAGEYGTAPQNMANAPSVASIGAPPSSVSGTVTAGLGIGPGASAMASLNPSVRPTASYGLGPGASAAGGVSIPGASASLAAPAYSDTPQGSWFDSLGKMIGPGLTAAKTYGTQYIDRAKSPENINAFAKQNPIGAMNLAAAMNSGSKSPGHPGGEGGHYSPEQNAAMRSKLADFVTKKLAKPKDKGKDKKKGGFTFRTSTTIFPKYSQASWVNSLRSQSFPGNRL